jgi:hypothetical protein
MVECRCSTSDPRKNTAAVAAINFCAIPCNGNADQRCGGWGYVDLYKSPVNSTQTPVNGTDNGVPTLPGYQGKWSAHLGQIELIVRLLQRFSAPRYL